MPRDGSNIYHKPFPDVAPNTTVASTVYNGFVADVEQDLNLPRPIVAGGTGSSSAPQSLANLGGETSSQVVTNYDTQLFMPGSFYSAGSATNPPVAAHAFVGIAVSSDAPAYPPLNQNVVLRAYDQNDTVVPGRVYVREKKAGVWSAWSLAQPSSSSGSGSGYRNGVGDTTADMFYGVTGTAPASQFVVNTKYDLSGTLVLRVGKEGAVRTGGGSPQSATAFAGVLSSYVISADQWFGYNSFLNAAGSWATQNAGYGGQAYIDYTNGTFYWAMSSASVAAGGTFTPVVVATLSKLGTLTLTAGISAKGQISTQLDGYQAINVTGLSAPGISGGMGIIGSGANSALNFNAIGTAAGGTAMSWSVGGTGVMSLGTAGGLTIATPFTATTPSLFAAGQSQAYVADLRCSASDKAAVIGWTINTLYYGMSGAYMIASGYWSFFGNTSAFLAGGAWTVSDARVKQIGKTLDTSSALAAVNALAVKEFTPKNAAARGMLLGHEDIGADEALYGWSAQEVELVVPIAVRNIPIPAVDRATRSALRNIDVPALDSKEAIALGEEQMSIKAINDRYMLTTLWAAVQRLSAQNDEMRAELETLKAAL